METTGYSSHMMAFTSNPNIRLGVLRMKSYLALVAFCLPVLLSTRAYGLGDEQPLTVYAGVTTYNNPEYDSVVLVEFPFSLNRHEFGFYRPDSNEADLYTGIFAQVNLFDAEGLPIDSARTFFSVRVASREEAALPTYRLFNRLVVFAKPGSYSARLTVIDAISKRRGEFFLGEFVVDSVEKENLAIGGVCLAYRVNYVGESNGGTSSRLVKNGFEIIPNPLSVFSTKDTMMCLYGEVYNLNYSDDLPSKFQILFSAWDAEGSLFRDLGGSVLPKPGSTAVIAESFDIKDWPFGWYRLQIVVSDHTSNKSDTTSVPLRIISPEEIRLAFSRAESGDPYDTLSLEVKGNLVAYLLTPEQKATLARLSDRGKINFLDQFWREHDEEPTTRVIENRLALIKRYEYCNRRFSANADKTDGWSTDRGRIYMTYGPEDEIDDKQFPLVGNPYQIWYYWGMKEGKVFVFEDWTGTGEYRLVHSNVYGEIYNQEWQDFLDTGIPDLPLDR